MYKQQGRELLSLRIGKLFNLGVLFEFMNDDEMKSNPWQIVFQDAKGVQRGSIILQILILVLMSSSSISALT